MQHRRQTTRERAPPTRAPQPHSGGLGPDFFWAAGRSSRLCARGLGSDVVRDDGLARVIRWRARRAARDVSFAGDGALSRFRADPATPRAPGSDLTPAARARALTIPLSPPPLPPPSSHARAALSSCVRAQPEEGARAAHIRLAVEAAARWSRRSPPRARASPARPVSERLSSPPLRDHSLHCPSRDTSLMPTKSRASTLPAPLCRAEHL